MTADPNRVPTPAEIREQLAAALGIEIGLDETAYPATLDVPADAWVPALTVLRDQAGLTYFDWLSAVDHGADGFQVVAHLAAVGTPGSVGHVLVRTALPAAEPSLATATGVFRGAAWHERETYEMFGIDFDGHPHLVPLLLPDAFEGHPLRKDFVLAARAAKPWPGAKEPGESGDGGPTRRKLQPPGVPDETWGPRTEPVARQSRTALDSWGPQSSRYSGTQHRSEPTP
jgi:NADH:ubiquinone oxidoreductase subunit C